VPRMFASFVLTAGAFLLLGQTNTSLDQAYNLLASGNYPAAREIAQAYLNRHSPAYRAEFIRAASDCKIGRGSESARQEMSALINDYDLGQRQLDGVNLWLNSAGLCKPIPTHVAPHNESGNSETSITQGLGSSPASLVKSIAPFEPNPVPLPLMSSFRYSTSFSGDDYGHLNGVKSAVDCSQTCRRQAPCRSMTYDTNAKICWLKRSTPPAQHGTQFISAFKLSAR